MIHQINMYGEDKVQVAIKRFKTFEPPEGYFLAFSGGKDSVVIKALADMAGVKYDAHYSVTSVDHPELVKFVKSFKDVCFERPLDKNGNQVTMWNLIARDTIPPTQIARYCCRALKEPYGEGRFTVTGIRWAESTRRKTTRGGLETADKKTEKYVLHDPDNPDQQMIHQCMKHKRRMLNPIIDWTTEDVWEFIKEYNIPYCSLYDRGYERLGCIGCPMGTRQNRLEQLEQYPQFRNAYIKAFEKMLENRKRKGIIGKEKWQTGEDVMEWWIR